MHINRSFLMGLSMIGVLLPALLGPSGVAAAANFASPDCGSWSTVQSPNPGQYVSGFNSVAAVSANNVVAVGGYMDFSSGVDKTLVEQWNGTSWGVVSSPSPGIEYNGLLGVARVPHSTQAWAVGYYSMTPIGPPQVYLTLIEHWNGTKWKVVPSPSINPGVDQNELYGVDALAGNDIWAVGSSTSTELIEHWDGKQWSIVPSAGVGGTLYAVKALAANDVWAVGRHGVSQLIIEHWDGTSWSQVSAPNPGSLQNGLMSIARVPDSKALWAVGLYENAGGPTQTLIEYWNGSNWSIVPSPNPDSSIDALNGVVSLSKHDVWAVGYGEVDNNDFQTLILQWNGTNWSVVPSPNPGPAYNDLNAVTGVPGTKDAWTVGDVFAPDQGTQGTLTAFYC